MKENTYPPKLSVVIPCFNKSEYLIEMLKCIKNQTFEDWELILVDDGSEDAEFNKVHAFVCDDTRITHIRRNRLPKNGDTCRNIGMDMARGEYLIIFDADDLISDTCFENRVKFMDEHPKCDYASFPYSTFFDGNDEKSIPIIKTIKISILSDLLSTAYPFTVWTNIYRKDAIKKIRWDENVLVYQDFDFMVQCELEGLKHVWSDSFDSDYYYREFTNGNSVCGNYITTEKGISTNYLFSKIIEMLGNRTDGDFQKNIFFQFVILHFERILLGCNYNQTMEYIENVISYYPDSYHTSCKIADYISKESNCRMRKIKIDYLLYIYFKYPIYRIQLIHDIVKFILRR